jgi:hypothetical protein
MSWIDYLFFINLVLVFFSGWVAYVSFNRENSIGGWFNVFASALNGAVFMDHFF